jgi:poly(ADP-ribose) glycohydrolase ARH3
MATDKLDRIRGALLGTAVGDALGMPVEGWSNTSIVRRYGEIREMLPERLGRGTYTDDTQMMIALAESMVRCQQVDGEDIANMYVKFCDPRRGYGGGALRALRRIHNGVSWRESGIGDFPGGSFGNGGAMRIAPIGVVYGSGEVEKLREVVEAAVYCTHTHPLGIDGAVCQARAIGIVDQFNSVSEYFSTNTVLKSIHDVICTKEFHTALNQVDKLLQEIDVSVEQVLSCLGNGIAALEAVPAALYAFLSHAQSFEDAVVYAVGLGGDTDTIGAMTGALSGAYLGVSQIPARWLEALEDGEYGRSYIEQLSEQLFREFSQ